MQDTQTFRCQLKHDPHFRRKISSREMNRLVITSLWSYFFLPSYLFLRQSCILCPTALRDSIWNLKPVSSNGMRSALRFTGQERLKHLSQVQTQCPIQTAMLPACYQVELKTKVILKDSWIIISPFCPLLKCLGSFSTTKMKVLLGSVFVLNSSG